MGHMHASRRMESSEQLTSVLGVATRCRKTMYFVRAVQVSQNVADLAVLLRSVVRDMGADGAMIRMFHGPGAEPALLIVCADSMPAEYTCISQLLLNHRIRRECKDYIDVDLDKRGVIHVRINESKWFMLGRSRR